jgi:peptidyl-prolyl cis-trans isomerase A (cyclophilin A)
MAAKTTIGNGIVTDVDGNGGPTALVKCGTSTGGSFTMRFHRDWSPNGYDRAVELFKIHYYDDSPFYRVVPKFLTQFGM